MNKTLKLELNTKKFFDFLSTVSLDKHYNHIEDSISVGCNLVDAKNIYKFKTERLSQGNLNNKDYYNEFELYSGSLFKEISKEIESTLVYSINYEIIEKIDNKKYVDLVYQSTCVYLDSTKSEYSYLYYYTARNSERDYSIDRFKVKETSKLKIEEISKRVKIINYYQKYKSKQKIWVNPKYKKLIKI
jgi:hypothetical protein